MQPIKTKRNTAQQNKTEQNQYHQKGCKKMQRMIKQWSLNRERRILERRRCINKRRLRIWKHQRDWYLQHYIRHLKLYRDSLKGE